MNVEKSAETLYQRLEITRECFQNTLLFVIFQMTQYDALTLCGLMHCVSTCPDSVTSHGQTVRSDMANF